MGSGAGEADIMDLLFNHGKTQGQQRKRKTKSVLYQMSVTLEDVYCGKTKYHEASRYRTCDSCSGNGTNTGSKETKCKGCNGQGMKTEIRRMGMAVMQSTQPCNDCKGFALNKERELISRSQISARSARDKKFAQ